MRVSSSPILLTERRDHLELLAARLRGEVPRLIVLQGGTVKSRFSVFLRCNVMRAESYEDLRFYTAPELAAAGVDDDWPRLEPRVMR